MHAEESDQCPSVSPVGSIRRYKTAKVFHSLVLVVMAIVVVVGSNGVFLVRIFIVYVRMCTKNVSANTRMQLFFFSVVVTLC